MKIHLVAAALIALAGASAQAQTVPIPILTFPTDWPTGAIPPNPNGGTTQATD